MSKNPLVVGGKPDDTKNRLDHVNQPPRLRPFRDRSGLERIEVEDISVGSSQLTEAAKQFSYDFTFTSFDWDTVTWTGGTLSFADDTSYTISSGTTGNMGTTAVRYIYFDSTVSTTALQVTTNEDLLASDTALLLCTAKRAISTSSSAFMVPYIGVMAVSDVNIQVNSISANMVQANAITATKISVTDLSSIKADLGEIVAGWIGNDVPGSATAAMRLTGTATLPSTNYIDFTATATGSWLKTGDLTIQANGTAKFSGDLQAESIIVRNSSGTIRGHISAATSNSLALQGPAGAEDKVLVGTNTVQIKAGTASVTCDKTVNNDITFGGDNTFIYTNVSVGGSGDTVGFYAATGVTKQTISTARDNPEGALADLLSALASLGLITDSSTAT